MPDSVLPTETEETPSLGTLFDIKNKTILVTGGGNGIGRGIALGLAGLGAKVTVWDLVPAQLEALVSDAKALGVTIDVASVDVADEDAVAKGIGGFAEGGLDAVFINAGVSGKAQPITELTLDNWKKVHAVNLDGAFLTAREAAKLMKPQGHGKIVFTGSVWGERGVRSAPLGAYMSSKGAIHNLIRQMAAELIKDGINVNGIAPSGFMTSLGQGELDDGFGEWLINRIPANRGVMPSEMAGPAAFLASRASDWVAGTVLPVDGGYLTE